MIPNKNNDDYILKYREDSEYIPLCAIDLLTIEYNRYEVYTLDEVKPYYLKFKESSIGKFFSHYNMFSRGYSRTIEDVQTDINSAVSELEEYISRGIDNNGISKGNVTWTNSTTKGKLLQRLTQNNSNPKVRVSRTNEEYNVQHLFCIKKRNESYIPLFTMVVKKEYVEYVKLCTILGKQPKGEIFEFWIHKTFDTKLTKDKYLRTQYRKIIKPILIAKNIPIVEKDNWFDDLYKLVRQPKVKTLRERKEWISSISKSFTEYLNPRSIQSKEFEVISVDESQYVF